jgi:hypothetical protein
MAQVLGFIDPKDREIQELKKEIFALYEINKYLSERLKTTLEIIETLNGEVNE